MNKFKEQLVFKSLIGETVKEYIRKRRLSLSFKRLKDKDNRILDIALDAGFESQEAYSRAFKNQFGISPGDCRKEQFKNVMILQKPQITVEYLLHLYEGFKMEPVIIKNSEFKLIGFADKFISILSPEKNNHIVIPKLWDKYFQRKNEIQRMNSNVAFGVCMPIENILKNHPDECLYFAGAEVQSFENVPVGMMTITIPAGEYAVFTHSGQLNNLDFTMNYIYGSWLPRSEKKLREAPDLELYDHRFIPDSDSSEFDIYIPIESQGE